MPSPGNQGAVGSCASWAVGYTLYGYYVRTEGLSGGDHAPMYLYSQLTGGQDVGSTLGGNLNLGQTQGVDTRSDYSQGDFNYTTMPTAAEIANAAHYQLTGWNQLFYGSGQGAAATTAIESALAAGHPVVLAMPVYTNFDSTGWLYPGIAGNYRGEHAVVAVGYDANGIIIQNSWGSFWGASGRTDLAFTFVNQSVWEADTANGIAQSAGLTGTTTSLVPSANPIAPNQSVTFTATVTPQSGAVAPTGTVSFTEGAASYGVGTLSAGTASVTTSIPTAAAHMIVAQYSGNAAFTGSSSPSLTENVAPGATATVVSIPAGVSAGQNTMLTASVSSPRPGAPLPPTGTVHFQDNGANISAACTGAQLSAGHATCSLALVVGAHLFTAAYGGDVSFFASTGRLSVTANAANAAVVVLDAYGGLHPAAGSTVNIAGAPSWPGWNIARGAVVIPGGSGGYTLDGWGGVHQWGVATPVTVTAYWPGWDIARGLTLNPCDANGHSGYVLDGWGGLHPFGGAPPLTTSSFWPGWDIAKGIAVNPCAGGVVTGYVLDGWGGLHSFSSGAAIASPSTGAAYWPGWNIARGVVVSAAGQGYTLDGWGGVHPFGGASPLTTSAHWTGWDIARGITVTPQGDYVVDGWGGLHSVGASAPLVSSGYTPGHDLARGVVAG